jgi:dolichyl-phosphate beta-glucosyltransferase
MISIVVPCYNEETRITQFLEKLVKICSSRNYEIIVIDDGSTDGTMGVVSSIIKGKKNCRVISYKNNMGKGFAVRTGVMAAKGNFIIFIDADGSIDPDEIKNMEKYAEKYDVIVGTRASKESVVDQPRKRKLIGMMFNFSVNTIFHTGIKDSLCGFKGFKKNVARSIFKDLRSNRWIFDVEVFYKIRKKKYSMFQMPIHWIHKENSKITLFDPVKMFFQLLVLRIKMFSE